MSIPVARRALVFSMSLIASFVVASSGFTPAHAQTAAAESAPKKIALVSMIGDEFTVVTQKESTGTNMLDNFSREVVRVPGQGLNFSVLRGLDQAVSREYPDAERILLTIPHSEDRNSSVNGKVREQAAFDKAVNSIMKMPQRQEWDRIVLVTPRWLFSQRQGMASKLSGIGLYIQPLQSAKMQGENGDNILGDFGLQFEDEVDTLKRGETKKSETFIAPFFYAVVTTLDAKTMNVIKREERYDFRKIIDPESTAMRIQNAIPMDQLAGLVDRFIETAAIRSVTDKKGTVEIGPLRSTPIPAEKK
jgi:hypothetical protein